ncbi:MAG: ATPase P [Syntrophales bacterium]|nr:ATPase P [Syntrophales bacterium]
MLEIDIPGGKILRLTHLILDYNGTIAKDGLLLEGVAERLETLAPKLEIHIITADTFGSVRAQVAGLPVKLAVIGPKNQDQAKADYLASLGVDASVAVGNGRNDALMLKKAALGLAVVQSEGAAAAALLAADVTAPGILEALDLLLHPDRLRATLRL